MSFSNYTLPYVELSERRRIQDSFLYRALFDKTEDGSFLSSIKFSALIRCGIIFYKKKALYADSRRLLLPCKEVSPLKRFKMSRETYFQMFLMKNDDSTKEFDVVCFLFVYLYFIVHFTITTLIWFTFIMH